MDWRTQHSKDAYSLQIDLSAKCNFYQNLSKVFEKINIYIDINVLKYIRKGKDTRRPETILRRMNELEESAYSTSRHTVTKLYGIYGEIQT